MREGAIVYHCYNKLAIINALVTQTKMDDILK